MSKIFHRGFLILAMLFVGITYTGAYFSDSVSVSGNTFSTGVWNPGRATISEVLYNPVGTDTGLEWVEIYNSGGYALNMTGYNLYADGAGYYTFPSFTLNTGALVVVHINTFESDTATDLYTGASSNMSNTAGSIAIFSSAAHNSSTIKDFVEYGVGSQTWQSAADTAGIWAEDDFVVDVAESHSIELISSDNNQSSDWQDQAVPTPGA